MTGYRDEPDYVKASESAYLCCPHCSGKILPTQKSELNSQGRWLKEGQTIDRNGVISGEGRHSRIASFWMEGPAAAYQSWSQLIYKLLTAEHEYELTGSEETLKAVINTDWGRPYLPRSALEQRRSDELMARKESITKRTVPDGCRFLLAAVDVQGGRKRRFNNALSRPTPGANYIHFPDWLGEWFFDELTYEERGADGKWVKPGKGNNEAFDLFCYIHAIAILRGYENIHWGDEDDVPSWAKRPQHNRII
ncbi:hypothetical protein A1D23_04660 [Chelonobacter oris]|nr:hypothetical protein [Chelonobacter oris]